MIIWREILILIQFIFTDMVKKVKKQDKIKTIERENHQLTEKEPIKLYPQNSYSLNPKFLEATKNILVNLSKKCHSIRKDSQIRKQWERQYFKNKIKKQKKAIQDNKQLVVNQKEIEKLPPIQKPYLCVQDERKQSRKIIQYQNQFLNKLLKDKQQKQIKNAKKKRENFELLEKWQDQHIEDQYMEVQLDGIQTLRSYQQNFDGKMSNQIEEWTLNNNQQKESLRKDINQSVDKRMKINLCQEPQKKQHIHLFNLKLEQLMSLFLSQLTSPQYRCLCDAPIKSDQSPFASLAMKTVVAPKCKCDHPTAVHRTVAADLSICLQIQKVIALLGYQNRFYDDCSDRRGKEEYCQRYVFNQDRIILFNNKGSLQSEVFSKQIVTPFDHRALAMLLKRINHKKYSLLVPKSSKNQRGKNYLLQKFYKELYEKSIQEYYKQLLQLELEYKRYAQITPSSQKIVIGKKTQKQGPSNFIRKMLTNIFQDRIRGKNLIKKEISELEQEIDACSMAEVLLGKMRSINEQKKEQKEINYLKGHSNQSLNILPRILFKRPLQPNQVFDINQESEEQKININKKYKFNPDLVGTLIDQNQKKSIQKTLLRFEKNKKQVPYPKCMFLEYRLRALRQQSYKNPNNPSSDQDQKLSSQSERQDKEKKDKAKPKDLHVYKGYRGYKTKLKILETRKRNKGITKNVQMHTNEELFYLNSLHDPKLNKLKQNKHFYGQGPDDLKLIPFPFYLSIFNQNKEQVVSQSDEIKDHMDNQNHKKSTQISDVIELSD